LRNPTPAAAMLKVIISIHLRVTASPHHPIFASSCHP